MPTGCARRRQTPRAIERFWRQVLVSAVNEELDRMAAAHGFQVFWLGMLARADSYEMGVPAVPLARALREQRWQRIGTVEHASAQRRSAAIRDRERRVSIGIRVAASDHRADYYVCAAALRTASGARSRICDRVHRDSSTRRSRASISGSTGRSPTCRTPRCSTAPSSGCSTRARAAMCSWWSALRAAWSRCRAPK